MEYSSKESGDGAACGYEGGRPVETSQGYFCGFHKQMPCERQGEPLTHEGDVNFTLYPCKAPTAVRAEKPAEGGLELKLAPRSA